MAEAKALKLYLSGQVTLAMELIEGGYN